MARAIFLVCSIICILCPFGLNADLVINNADRSIDLTSQTAKVTTHLTIENAGSSSVKDFEFAVEEELSQHLAFLDVSEKQDEDSKLQYTDSTLTGKSGKFFKVSFPSPLASKKSISVTVNTVFTHVLKPFPEKIGQSDKQLVVFKANTVLYSPYAVKEQKTSLKLSSSTIESYSRLKPSSSNDNTISYGPYKDSKPFRTHEMRIHFENNSPFLTVNELTRWIEVSHWGNIAVEETYHISHQGAQLKGHFSRYDYQRTPTHAAIKSFKTVLPASAKDVYYRDEIGNISTSNMLVQDDSVELEIRPRFPLFGGWQTRYYMGYNVPAYQYLYTKGDQYILNMRFVDHVFDDFIIDRLTVKVVLPEGVSNVKVQTPYPVTEEKKRVHKTYLDTTGRTVLVLRKESVVESHIQDFQVHYTFKKIQLLQEPLLCVAAFYILFVSVIALVRLDFSITKDTAKESRLKIASFVEDLLSACEKRSALYTAVNTAIDKFKQSRDQTVFANAQKKINQDYTTLTTSINETSAALKKEDPELTEKLVDLTKKENERKVVFDQLITLATKVASGKLGRQQYLENEQQAQTKREKLSDEIESVLATL